MNSQDIRNRFKKPDLDKEKERQDAELAANNIQRLTLVNEKLPQLKLSQAGTRPPFFFYRIYTFIVRTPI